jgi:hypothetical protein
MLTKLQLMANETGRITAAAFQNNVLLWTSDRRYYPVKDILFY